MSNIDKTIDRGISFLAKEQQAAGNFLTLTSPDLKAFKNATTCASLFSSALILSCLSKMDGFENKKAEKLKKKIADFLVTQRSEYWSFNYWVRNSKQSKEMPYPDDLDDTACVLAALNEYDQSLIDGDVLAGVATALTALETKEGGPYKTWLVPPDAPHVWKDVDLVVNSNIGYFLSLQGVKLKNITRLVESSVEEENYVSPYYPSMYPVVYFVSRYYKGKKKKDAIHFLLSKQKGDNWGSPLNTALAILALLNFGCSADKLKEPFEYLLKKQKEDGSWATDVFYAGINPDQHKGDKRRYYAGCPALSTAFCVEAIYRANVNFRTANKESSKPSKKNEESAVYRAVTQRAKDDISILGTELKKESLVMLKRLIKSDKDKQIVLLPYLFLKSVKPGSLAELRTKSVSLGLANFYGWMAYTIYDDFLDDEGEPKMLSVANVALRESNQLFLDTVHDGEFGTLVKKVFNRIDAANAWELEHCRVKEKTVAAVLAHTVPDFGDIAHLADRSLGHALGPIGILCVLGEDVSSQKSKNVLEAFRHYISAKQIHDDMHDWEDDLSRGQINCASAKLFSMIKNKKVVPTDPSAALLFLQHKFWKETVVVLCERVYAHLEQARALFLQRGDSTGAFADQILNPLVAATDLTLRERKNAKQFIAKYSKNSDKSESL